MGTSVNPETHLLASWVIGAKGTDNARDCRLVALAEILPDADGLGLLVDGLTRALGWKKTFFYEHLPPLSSCTGSLGAILITGACCLFRPTEVACGPAWHCWSFICISCAISWGRADLTRSICGRFFTSALSLKIRCGSGKANCRWMLGRIGC